MGLAMIGILPVVVALQVIALGRRMVVRWEIRSEDFVAVDERHALRLGRLIGVVIFLLYRVQDKHQSVNGKFQDAILGRMMPLIYFYSPDETPRDNIAA